MIPHYVWEDILRQVEQDRPLIRGFCEERAVRLKDIFVTSERAPEIPYEAMYIFTDGRGGYTIDGIMNSLDNGNEENQKKK